MGIPQSTNATISHVALEIHPRSFPSALLRPTLRILRRDVVS